MNEPNDTTIAAINEDREDLETMKDFDILVASLKELPEIDDEELIVGGYSTPMTHAERQEWWRTSDLGKKLGVDMGDADS